MSDNYEISSFEKKFNIPSNQDNDYSTNDLSHVFNELKNNLAQHIIGQEQLLERLIIALLADGHLLVEGAPGLAKTKAVKTLSQFIEATFQRIQFTPDLLPTDITGTEIYRAQTGEFTFEKGPIFHNLILADEINRAPAKAQSALLEAMAERQVTIGRHTYKLPELFLVMATQNPIEQHGTYPLPEAQLDRFLMHVTIDYPNINTEKQILKCVQNETQETMNHIVNKHNLITIDKIITARKQILDIHLSENLELYLLHLVMATRTPEKYVKNCHHYIEYGASPRASIALARCAKTVAWLANRDYVIPEDIKNVAPDILRHRIILSYLAEAEKVTTNDCINEILQQVSVP
jgi:MoxR-like ATPase